MTPPLRVLVAEDNRDLGLMLVALVEAQSDLQCVGRVASLSELRAALEALDEKSGGRCCVILDIELRGESSLPQLRGLRSAWPGVRFVVFSGHNMPELIRGAAAAGASGYVVKSDGPDALLAAVRAALLPSSSASASASDAA